MWVSQHQERSLYIGSQDQDQDDKMDEVQVGEQGPLDEEKAIAEKEEIAE